MAFPINPADGDIYIADGSIYRFIAVNKIWKQLRHAIAYEYTVAAGVSDGDKLIALKGLPSDNYIATIEIVESTGAGANYDFILNSSSNDAGLITPIVVDSHNSHINYIHTGWTRAKGRYIAFDVKASAAGKKYTIIVTSNTMDYANVQAGGPNETATGLQGEFDANLDYPGTVLTEFFRAKTGDASATIPAGKNPGDNLNGQVLTSAPNTITRTSGLVWNPNKNFTPLIRLRNGSTPIDLTKIVPMIHIHTKYSANGTVESWNTGLSGYGGNGLAIFTSSDPGFFACSFQTIKTNTKARWSLTIDTRDPGFTYLEFEIYYTNASGGQVRDFWNGTYPASEPEINRFYYSNFTVEGVPEWRSFIE